MWEGVSLYLNEGGERGGRKCVEELGRVKNEGQIGTVRGESDIYKWKVQEKAGMKGKMEVRRWLDKGTEEGGRVGLVKTGQGWVVLCKVKLVYMNTTKTLPATFQSRSPRGT